MTLDELPFREREALQQTLLEGEQVVWLGRPQPYLFSFVSRSLALVTVFLVLFRAVCRALQVSSLRVRQVG